MPDRVETGDGQTWLDDEVALRSAGLRVTKPRLTVLAAVRDNPHADTETLIAATRARLPEVSHQAVYDSLAALAAAGIIRRIQPTGSLARYERQHGDNHHHIVCRSCGAITDVQCHHGAAPCMTPMDDHGYLVDEAEVIYWGTCPSCAAKAS